MANEYISKDELKATLSIDGSDTFADPDLALAVSAASRAIDKVCGRRFWKDADANQARYYTPDLPFRDDSPAPEFLAIDDLVELTSFKVDADGDGAFETTWTSLVDFVLAPLNAQADGEPWTYVKLLSRLPRTERSVEVTGKFGWPAVPDQVKEAATILASKLAKRAREAPFGVAGIGYEGAAVRIARTDPDVCWLLEPLKKTAVG